MTDVHSIVEEVTTLVEPCIQRLLEARVTQDPDAIAITSPGLIPLTYHRLYSQISEIGTQLNSMDIGRNDRVAMVLPQGPETAVAFLAVSASATCAPLNPAYSAHEFDFYLADLKAKAVVIQTGMDSQARTVAERRGLPIIELFPMPGEGAGIFTLNGGKNAGPIHNGFAEARDVALVLYTSGTTSRPKLVPLTHTNLCTSALNMRVAYELTNGDRCLNVASLYYIQGVMVTLASLVTGGSVVCTPGFDASKFFEWVEAFRPTWYSAAPSVHQAVLMQAKHNPESAARCTLRFIRSVAAPLPPQIMLQLEDALNTPVLQSWGMTEAYQLTSNPLPPGQRKPASAGVVTGPEVAIMDESGNLLPTGETGEIVVRGTVVMPGYENNPAANRKAFTKGWFRTGDQGFLDDDGYLFITGRIKEIINRGGEKIAPREVDEALLTHPDIAQAVAFAVPHVTLGEDVAAAVVLREDASVTEEEIRKFAAGRLVDFKVPSRVLILDEIPKGPTEKLQRIGLAEKLASKLNGTFVAPRNPIEKKIAGIWSEILGVEQVGIHDNFFELGGHSLLATQVISQLREAFQVEFPLRSLFETPTVAGLAVPITQRKVEQVDKERLTQVLAELDQLSADEVQALLAAKHSRKDN